MRPCAARRVRSLHRRSEGRRTRAIPGPLRLSPHPCGSPLCATIVLTLLKGAFDAVCGFVQQKAKPGRIRTILQTTRSPIPVRRPSGGVAQGDARHGRRARNEGAGTPLRDGPRSDTGAREVWPQARPGCRARFLFGYFLFRASKEKVTRPGGRNQKVSVHSVSAVITEVQLCRNIQYCQSDANLPEKIRCPKKKPPTQPSGAGLPLLFLLRGRRTWR